MKARNEEQEYLADYVADWLDDQVDKTQLVLKVIELARLRVVPMELMLRSVETFAQTPGLPARAVQVFVPALREVIENVSLDWRSLEQHALLILGRNLLEPTEPGSKSLKPIGYVKPTTGYKWVKPSEVKP